MKAIKMKRRTIKEESQEQICVHTYKTNKQKKKKNTYIKHVYTHANDIKYKCICVCTQAQTRYHPQTCNFSYGPLYVHLMLDNNLATLESQYRHDPLFYMLLLFSWSSTTSWYLDV